MTWRRLSRRHARRRAERERCYRCVICWRIRPWYAGCADVPDIMLGDLVNQRVFADQVILDRPMARIPVTDGGLCDDCWAILGDEQLVVREAA